jgi:hydrogenase maturation protein HypF
VLFPLAGADGLDRLREHAEVDDAEACALRDPARPIVLVRKSERFALSRELAPGLAVIGAFLPYSPLHHLLLNAFDGPLVATSGNVSGEPVLIDNAEATERLTGIVDAFLHHDRPIVRPADDPVMRRMAGQVRPLRHGRGTAPTQLPFTGRRSGVTLAVGAHMKGTVALAWGDRAIVSPHIGEMHAARSLDVFERTVEDLQALYGVRAERVICDHHPGYTTHRWARHSGLPVETVQHHVAHASALAGEHAAASSADTQWLVFTWDGVGLGDDGNLWGGEAFVGGPGAWQRAASLRPFRLVGGERAGREPWRSAAGLCWECERDWVPAPDPDGLARAAWQRGLNAPVTTAAGRLFDAAAALILGHTHASYEAEGPMRLESLCRHRAAPVPVEQRPDENGLWRADWESLLDPLMDTAIAPAERAEIFHASMAQLLVDQAVLLRDERRIDRIGLCGGVFQNRVLTELAFERLTSQGFDVVLSERLPANDAAISYGQAIESDARSD